MEPTAEHQEIAELEQALTHRLHEVNSVIADSHKAQKDNRDTLMRIGQISDLIRGRLYYEKKNRRKH